ncbi:MAG: class B sortase [Lachnospiraceae bacterium]|nr:class B sortase [Lachnospiraceae bacterium]
MAYTLGKYTFSEQKEYQAACRDLQRISALKKQGRTAVEVAKNSKKQIQEQQIRFESVIGDDYVKQLDQTLFVKHANGKGAWDTVSSSGGKNRGISGGLLNDPFHLTRNGRRFALKMGTMIAFMIMFAFVGYVIYLQAQMDYKSAEDLEALAKSVEASENKKPAAADTGAGKPVQKLKRVILPQYEGLYEQNPDLAGWLRIPDTVIDYPVMYLKDDNDFYLKHNFRKEEDNNGLLVLDKRCDRNGDGISVLIHGHHMKSGKMFGSLKKYESKAYEEEHSKIYYDTLYEQRVYGIIGVFISSVYNSNRGDFQYYDYIDIRNKEEFDTYVQNVKEQSLYDTGLDAKFGDELITLSTCEYSRSNGRLVVVGRRIYE